MARQWIKPILTLATMGIMAWFLPSAAVDPWNLLNPQKIATMVFALAFIQVLGTVLNRILGARTGALLTGFFGGLVSSTATTASLARKSKIEGRADVGSEMLIFLSTTGAMLVEGFALVWFGTSSFHLSTLITLIGPLFATAALIYFYSRQVTDRHVAAEDIQFRVLPILKLAMFIVSILVFSKLLQNIFGQNGLLLLTFLTSLFEIHGSIIANIQLHESAAVTTALLSKLLAVSIFASYLSKLFLIWALGSRPLRTRVLKCTIILIISLAGTAIISLSL